jgi:hypothetical protein
MKGFRIVAGHLGLVFSTPLLPNPMPFAIQSNAAGSRSIAYFKKGIIKNTLTLIGLLILSCQLQAQVSFTLSATLNPGNNPEGVIGQTLTEMASWI